MKELLFNRSLLFTFAILIGCSVSSFAQKSKSTVFTYDQDLSPSDRNALQDKYWFYRHRLTTEFLKKGLGTCGVAAGYGIPACQAYKDKGDMLHFGDGTSFLGNYIGVLATEYLLLKRSAATEEQLSALKEELYYAMKSYERLDYNAEIIVPPYKDSCSGKINGFFLRDDVDVSTYLIDFATPYDPAGDMKTMVSDFTSAKDADPCTSGALRFPTVDQISNLLVGFALVVKCMDDASYVSELEVYPFKVKAKEYTHTIMTYMKEVNYLIKHPTEGCNVRYNEGGYLLAYGLAQAAQTIVDERFDKTSTVKLEYGENNLTQYESSNTFLSSAVWQNNINYPQGKDFFRLNFEAKDNERSSLMRFTDAVIGSGGLYGFTDAHDYNNAVVAQTAAIANVLKIGLVPYTQRVKVFGRKITLTCYDGNIPQYAIGAVGSYTRRFPFLKAVSQIATALPLFSVPCDGCLPELSVNTTAVALSAYGDIADIQYFATLHEFLHGNGPYSYDKDFLVMLLKEAPASGPHYKPFRDPSNPPANGDWNTRSSSEGSIWWRQDNRWEKSSRTHEPDQGAWNGLDYMIAYNVFMLVHEGQYKLPAVSIDDYRRIYLEPSAALVSNDYEKSTAAHRVCMSNVHDVSINLKHRDLASEYAFLGRSGLLSSRPALSKTGKLTYSLALFWHPVYPKH